MLFKDAAKSRRLAPTEENISLNASEITKARNNPITPPKIAAKHDVRRPSKTAKARKSERLKPNERVMPDSLLLSSASMMMIVITRSIPATIVNVPKTRNIADNIPAPSSAEAYASILMAFAFSPNISWSAI